MLIDWAIWWNLWPSDQEAPDLLLFVDGAVISLLLIACSLFFSGRPLVAWLGLSGSWRRSVRWALVGALATYAVAAAFLCSFWVLNPDTDPGTQETVLSSSGASLGAVSLPGVIVGLFGLLINGLVGPIGEELFFRGYVFTSLIRRGSPLFALIISSVLFAAYHLDYVHFLDFFGTGLVLGYVRMKAGTKASIGAHALFNSSLDILKALLSAA